MRMIMNIVKILNLGLFIFLYFITLENSLTFTKLVLKLKRFSSKVNCIVLFSASLFVIGDLLGCVIGGPLADK